MSEGEPGPVVVSLVWALDEVFTGFAGRPVVVVREQLEEACEVWGCRLDEDTLDVFAAEIAAGERVEGVARTSPPLVHVPDIALTREAWPDVTMDEQREFVRLFTASDRAPGECARSKRFAPSRIEITWQQRQPCSKI
ncbi:hypothetical protein [Amycolatopsis sp. cmx-11-12]|uniref:hypothetical protein n=1 Tax=Amycolatopsis sp. cmx-11-12 TaxID=2785795 RepID=UPI003917C6BD